MSWIEEYPHNIYQQVLLSDGKIINWRVGGVEKRGVYDWKFYDNSFLDERKLEQKTNIISVNTEEEHNAAFKNIDWFRQFEYSEKYKGAKCY